MKEGSFSLMLLIVTGLSLIFIASSALAVTTINIGGNFNLVYEGDVPDQYTLSFPKTTIWDVENPDDSLFDTDPYGSIDIPNMYFNPGEITYLDIYKLNPRYNPKKPWLYPKWITGQDSVPDTAYYLFSPQEVGKIVIRDKFDHPCTQAELTVSTLRVPIGQTIGDINSELGFNLGYFQYYPGTSPLYDAVKEIAPDQEGKLFIRITAAGLYTKIQSLQNTSGGKTGYLYLPDGTGGGTSYLYFPDGSGTSAMPEPNTLVLFACSGLFSLLGFGIRKGGQG